MLLPSFFSKMDVEEFGQRVNHGLISTGRKKFQRHPGKICCADSIKCGVDLRLGQGEILSELHNVTVQRRRVAPSAAAEY